jgi:GT2 family glycosyltransferase
LYIFASIDPLHYMDVSVIIINYNTFELTCNTIRSVIKFTTGVEYEIILVDNASPECDADLFVKEFPGIKLIKSPENVGFAKGNNLGIKSAVGKYILLLNSDVVLIENSILNCFSKLFSLSKDTAAITCKLIYPDGRIQYQCNRFPGITNEVIEFTRLHKLFSEKKRANQFLSSYFDHLTDINPDWIWGTFFMFKMEYLSLLPEKKLNEDYFMYCEDMKWCYDFKQAGKNVYYFAGTAVIHFVGQSLANKTTMGLNVAQNGRDFIIKTKGWPYLVAYKMVSYLNAAFSSSRTTVSGIKFR